MNKYSHAINLLQKYAANKAAQENFKYEMDMINSRLYSGGSEKTVIDMIDAKDRLVARTHKAVKEIKQTEAALRTLTQYQKDLLTAFYISGAHSCAESLAERYNVERST
ncbi:MAG: hypothetical protein J6V84_02400, partial [Clostridia bacterium]|nr:hypothetical protein [Clostridia bacterium]